MRLRFRKSRLRCQSADGLQSVLGDPVIDQNQRPGVHGVVSGGSGHDLVRSGNRPRLADPARVRRVVAEVVFGGRAVGSDGPQAQCWDDRPVDVVPSHPEDLSVVHHRRVPLVGLAERELANVRPVSVAAIEEIGRTIAIALVTSHAALVARRDKGKPTIGQVAGIVILDAARSFLPSAPANGSSAAPVICLRPVPSTWIS